MTKRIATFFLLLYAAFFCFQQQGRSAGWLPLAASPTGGCSQATTFLARTSGLSGTQSTAYTTMICGMVTDGTYCGTVQDGFYIFATNTTTTANLNLCSTSFGLTATGSPTFTANQGYTGTGATTDYLSTGFVPRTAGGNMVLNSTSLSVCVFTSRTTNNNYVEVGVGGSGGDFTYIKPEAGNFESDINNGAFPTGTNANAQGNWIISRTGSANYAVYNNGVATSFSPRTSTSDQLPDVAGIDILVLNNNNSIQSATADQLGAVWFGAGVGATPAANISTRIRAYFAAVGAPSGC
jgi:hypothetical protein